MTDGTGLRKPGPPSALPGPASEPVGGTVRRVLGVLFPEAPEPRPVPVPESGPGHADVARSAGRRAACVAIYVAAVCMGVAVLLPRSAGIPSWDSVYAEDQRPGQVPAGVNTPTAGSGEVTDTSHPHVDLPLVIHGVAEFFT